MNNAIHDFRGHDPYVLETTKVAELKDRFGRTRFKVALTDFDPGEAPCSDDLRGFDRAFQVTVVSYCYAEDAVTVVCRDFADYGDAARFFGDMTDQYSRLVRAETRDVQDIRIYADRTGYRVTAPDCCATCRWGRACGKGNCLFPDWEKNLRGRYVCTNAKLYLPPRRDLEPDRGQHDKVHDYCTGRMHVVDVHPVVDPLGICDGFERQKDAVVQTVGN